MNDMIETIGQRIARLRQECGLTQQSLADRIAVSRVAVSHIEMDLSLPGERTVTLMAGVFKISPHDLVEGTTYPHTKSERLPSITCCHTDLDMDISLIENDLTWLKRLQDVRVSENTYQRWRFSVWEYWRPRISRWDENYLEERMKERLTKIRQALKKACIG